VRGEVSSFPMTYHVSQNWPRAEIVPKSNCISPIIHRRAPRVASSGTTHPVMLAPARLPTTTHATLIGHEGPVLCVRFNKDGKYVLTCGKDRTFKLWNPRNGCCIKTYSGHAHPVLDIDTANDNSRVATCGGNGDVFVWDVTSGGKIRKFKGHQGNVNSVRFTGEHGSVVATAGFDRSVRFWDCRSNATGAIQTVTAFGDAVMSIDTKDTRIVAGSVDGTVRTFDVRTGKQTSDDFGGEKSVTDVSFSRDGRCLLVGTLSNRLALLDIDEGEVLAEYPGRTSETSKIPARLTHDDAHVVSGSEDGKVFIWELVDAAVEATIGTYFPFTEFRRLFTALYG